MEKCLCQNVKSRELQFVENWHPAGSHLENGRANSPHPMWPIRIDRVERLPWEKQPKQQSYQGDSLRYVS